MSVPNKAHVRFDRIPPGRRIVQHQFAVGQKVRVLPSSFGRKTKESEKSLNGDDFEVTRLLPTEAHIFQYRIKNTTTGQERVVSESELSVSDADGSAR